MAWMTVSDMCSWEVVPTRIASPLHCWLTSVDTAAAVRIRANGSGMSLLEWHARRGFALLKEGVVKSLQRHLGVTVKTSSSSHAEPAEAALAAMVVKVLKPANAEQLEGIMRQKLVLERPEEITELDEMMGQDILHSCLPNSDVQDAKTFVQKTTEQHNTVSKKRAHLTAISREACAAAGIPSEGGGEGEPG
eukprot:2785733-Amphidinium_carterae.1